MNPQHETRQVPADALRALASASSEGALHRVFAVGEEVMDALEAWSLALAAADELEAALRVAQGILALDAKRERAAEVVRRIEEARADVPGAGDENDEGGASC